MPGFHSSAAAAGVALAAAVLVGAARPDPPGSLLQSHLLVTYYGNPHAPAMGILGSLSGEARAEALRRQADAYAVLTKKRILGAYHLVAAVAQPHAGADGMWRRRESSDIIRRTLDDARQYGFHLVLDVQPGRAFVRDELVWLREFLAQPDVHLALDPEFDMAHGETPGRTLGRMPAAEINDAARFLSGLVVGDRLPPKVLIVHQFAVSMLPDVDRIESAPGVDVVLDMDGFGSQALKRTSYRTVTRRWRLPFVGIKLFYTIDRNLFQPADVMALEPQPAVIIYQ